MLVLLKLFASYVQLHLIVLVVGLQNRLRALVVGPDGLGLPPPVVPRGIRLVELEAVVLVPAREEERYTERALPTKLGVAGFSIEKRERVQNLCVCVFCSCVLLICCVCTCTRVVFIFRNGLECAHLCVCVCARAHVCESYAEPGFLRVIRGGESRERRVTLV